MNRAFCMHEGRGGWGCGNPTRFIARHESEDTASVFACGKHIAAELETHTDDRWIVVVVNKKGATS
jgi:hypothetical protein